MRYRYRENNREAENRGMKRERVGSGTSMGDNGDWDLVYECLGGNESCFSELVRRHFSLVFNICYRFFSDKQVAEDASQDVFLKVYEKIKNSSLSQGRTPFVHWLCRVTTNTCKSIYRKQRSERKNIDHREVDFWYGDRKGDMEGSYSDSEKQAVDYVNMGLQTIDKEERMVLILSHMLELKTKEISSIVKKPGYTVRRELKRGEEKLRKYVKQRMIRDNVG